MTRRKPRFEVVRAEGGCWFVRFVGANGRIVWVTPGLYSKRRDALRAIELITGYPVRPYSGVLEVAVGFGVDDDALLEVREVQA